MPFWHVVAEDMRGARWSFVVEFAHQPAAIDVVKLLRSHGRAVELTGRLVESATLDFGSVQVAGNDAAVRRIQGGAPRFSIHGVRV